MFCLQQKQKTQNVQQENKLFLVHADTVEDFARSFENTSFSNAKANPNHKKNLLPIYRTVRSAYLRMLVPTCVCVHVYVCFYYYIFYFIFFYELA